MNKYSKKHSLKIYEVNCFGDLKLLSLFNILQEAASEHAEILGIGYEECLKREVAWVAASYRVDIKRLPKIGEQIQIETWIADLETVTSQRCYRIKDENNNLLAEGITNWALISTKTLRPVIIAKSLQTTPEQVDGERLAFSDEKIRLSEPERIDKEYHFVSRFDEMDTNFHINNAVYPAWAAESLGQEWLENKPPKMIQINFKNAIKAFENVDIFTQIENNETLHKITVNNQTKAIIKIDWLDK